MTPFIMSQRGLTAEPLEVSSLLRGPEVDAIKARGGLVGDRIVVELVLRALLAPQYKKGVIVDGFPRTSVQVWLGAGAGAGWPGAGCLSRDHPPSFQVPFHVFYFYFYVVLFDYYICLTTH